MALKLKPYPKYKESGVPWLGKIPREWETGRAKWLFRKKSRPFPPTADVVTCFRDGIVTLRKNRRERGFTESLKEIGYQGVKKSDLVIHAMDAFAGAVGVSDSEGKCTPVYAVCEPIDNAITHFYAHVVRQMARSQWIAALAKGIRERSTDFRFEGFANQIVPIPPNEKQVQIAKFLAQFGRWVNRLIRSKRRLIELLNEQKQAIIHQAVTRGLDPNVRLKPSGIEWLGDVPEYWEVVPLKRVARLHRGYDLPDYKRHPGEFPIVSSGGVIGLHSNKMVDGPGVVTGRYGSTGVVYYIESDFWPHNTSLYVSDFCGNVPRFAFYLLHIMTFNAYNDKAAVPGIDRKDLHTIKVVCPSHGEQTAIAKSLDGQMERLEVLISKIGREIECLREYRTRLIADVVTGKLDVTGVKLTETEMEIEFDDDVERNEPEIDEAVRSDE